MVGALVSGVLFVGVLSAALVATEQPDHAVAAMPRAHADAAALLATLIDSDGVGWINGADGIDRLGLTNATGVIDSDHMGALKGAFEEAIADNGKVDYEEAHASLGLDPTMDFHLRIRPVTIGVAGVLDLGHLEAAYLGGWSTLGSYDVAQAANETMIAEAQALIDTDMDSQTEHERQVLGDLGLAFIDDVYVAPNAPAVDVAGGAALLDTLDVSELAGDVYPDHKQYLDDVLPGRLPGYDVLLVGSRVDQSSLTSAGTKNAIRDWVLDGGLLVVLGSDAQNYQWLQPLFQVGTTTVNGGAFASDPNHPMLTDPNELQWEAYDNHELGWDLNDQGSGANYDDFIHVVTEDGEDVLTFSKTGAFEDGRILLTSWRPKEVFDEISQIEAQSFLENLLVYFDRDDLRLEYGPAVPTDVVVAAAVREAVIQDPDLGAVPVRIELHLWGS